MAFDSGLFREVIDAIANGVSVVVEGVGRVVSYDPDTGVGQTSDGQYVRIHADGSGTPLPNYTPPAASSKTDPLVILGVALAAAALLRR